MNEVLILLFDGGDNVRNLQLLLSPEVDHVLDWFHVTMRITVMRKMAKSVVSLSGDPIDKKLESIKFYLWHGNVYKALNKV